MANIFDFRGSKRGAPGPWQRRPSPNWHRPHARRRGLAGRLALFLAFFLLGAGIAAAALNYQRMPELASYLRSERVPVALEPGRSPAPSSQPRPSSARERFTAVDGDSLRNGSGDVRLAGIDAPELHQTCGNASGRSWDCGRAAHARLRTLVSRGADCRPEGRDRYGRTLARCYDGERDIGETLVREGLAVDFMGGGYAGAEAEARAARRGIWAGSFDRPQDYRRNSPRAAR